jgi:proteasome beta subunit
MDDELKKSIRKTGTSIVGIICKDGVVLAADKQSSLGSTAGAVMVSNKREDKIFPINEYTITSTAGIVSETQLMLKVIRAELKLKELKSKTKPTVKEIANLFSTIAYQKIRQFTAIPAIAGYVIAGYDSKPGLFSISPDGAVVDEKEYVADGSGMMFILGLLERQYKKDMTVKQGIELAIEAIKASSQRDVASGFGIDVFTVTKDGIKHVVKQKIEPIYKETK